MKLKIQFLNSITHLYGWISGIDISKGLYTRFLQPETFVLHVQ